MPSEKMRYIIRRRMEEAPRTDIEPTPLKADIEAACSKRNLDEDGDTIARLLSPYREMVQESLGRGDYAGPSPSCSKCLKASLTTLWKTNTTITSTTCILPIMFAKT